MTLNQYKKLIDEMVKRGHGSKGVVFASDAEGNSYSDIIFSPTILTILKIEEVLDVYSGETKSDLICIN